MVAKMHGTQLRLTVCWWPRTLKPSDSCISQVIPSKRGWLRIHGTGLASILSPREGTKLQGIWINRTLRYQRPDLTEEDVTNQSEPERLPRCLEGVGIINLNYSSTRIDTVSDEEGCRFTGPRPNPEDMFIGLGGGVGETRFLPFCRVENRG